MSDENQNVDPRLRPALETVIDPELRRPVTELGMIPEATLESGTAKVTVLLTVSGCPLRSTIEADLREALGSVEGVADVVVDVGVMTPAQRQQLRERLGPHPGERHGQALLEASRQLSGTA